MNCDGMSMTEAIEWRKALQPQLREATGRRAEQILCDIEDLETRILEIRYERG